MPLVHKLNVDETLVQMRDFAYVAIHKYGSEEGRTCARELAVLWQDLDKYLCAESKLPKDWAR